MGDVFGAVLSGRQAAVSGVEGRPPSVDIWPYVNPYIIYVYDKCIYIYIYIYIYICVMKIYYALSFIYVYTHLCVYSVYCTIQRSRYDTIPYLILSSTP